uniref:Uncharacterized protein n=1 Tax=Oryza barthii TaxID=65489 RepID=A0A0D3HKK6_9ORYZ
MADEFPIHVSVPSQLQNAVTTSILDDTSTPTFGDLDESKDPSDGILDDTSAPTFRNLDESKDPPDGLGRNQLEDTYWWLREIISDRKKKKNDDSPAEVVQLRPVTEMQPQPYAIVLGNLEVPNDQAFLHVSQYYAALDASTSNPTHVSMTPENQGLHQQGRSIQQFDTDLYNLFN